MTRGSRLLAVIPARGGSTGLPGKNTRPFAGLPLIAHSILLAKMCREIERCIVSTDSRKIAAVARRFGAEVPFLRPPELARTDTPIWPVLRHALAEVEKSGQCFTHLALLDPTSPTRLPEDLRKAYKRLKETPSADGIVSVSQPDFNPVWHCVVDRRGWMSDFMENGGKLKRRQEAPTLYRINGLLYIWRADFVRSKASWRTEGRHLMYETPDSRASSIDTLEQFERTEFLVKGGRIRLPWLKALRSA